MEHYPHTSAGMIRGVEWEPQTKLTVLFANYLKVETQVNEVIKRKENTKSSCKLSNEKSQVIVKMDRNRNRLLFLFHSNNKVCKA